MQQIKIFKGVESNLATLEEEVNSWLRTSGARIVSLTGNIAPQSTAAASTSSGLGQTPFPPSDVVLVALYEAGG